MNPPRRNSPSLKTLNPRSFLTLQHAQDVPVFDLLQLARSDRRDCAARPQLSGAQQAADIVGTIFKGHDFCSNLRFRLTSRDRED